MERKELIEMLRHASEVADQAHDGQRDKADMEYIFHVWNVATNTYDILDNIDITEEDTDKAVAVAYLHDVVEDTDYTLDDLRAEFPEDVVDGVDSVTRREGETYGNFIKRAAENKYGKYVKYADLKDHLDITDFKKLTNEDLQRINKYLKWYHFLEKKIYG